MRMISENAFFKAQKLVCEVHDSRFVRGAFLNNKRHVVLVPDNHRLPTYYVLFKRDFFMTFNDQFKAFLSRFPEFKGVGESINKKWLIEACRRSERLLFYYEDKGAYYVEPMVIKKFCEKHGLIRVQETANFYNERFSQGLRVEHEETYSFPIKLLRRLEC